MSADIHTGQEGSGRTTAFHQILILLLGGLFLNRGGESLEERVTDAVSDPVRAERATEFVRRIDDSRDEKLDELVRHRGEIYQLLARHDAGSAELHRELDGLVTQLHAAENAILDLHMELRDQLEEEEWTEVFEE